MMYWICSATDSSEAKEANSAPVPWRQTAQASGSYNDDRIDHSGSSFKVKSNNFTWAAAIAMNPKKAKKVFIFRFSESEWWFDQVAVHFYIKSLM